MKSKEVTEIDLTGYEWKNILLLASIALDHVHDLNINDYLTDEECSELDLKIHKLQRIR